VSDRNIRSEILSSSGNKSSLITSFHREKKNTKKSLLGTITTNHGHKNWMKRGERPSIKTSSPLASNFINNRLSKLMNFLSDGPSDKKKNDPYR